MYVSSIMCVCLLETAGNDRRSRRRPGFVYHSLEMDVILLAIRCRCTAMQTVMLHLLTHARTNLIGSNEILMSKEKIVTMIDGSGVLYDPHVSARRDVACCNECASD